MAVWTTTRLVNTGTGTFSTSGTSLVTLDTVPAATVWSISKFMLEMKLSGSNKQYNFSIQVGPTGSPGMKIFDTNGTITTSNSSITFPANGVFGTYSNSTNLYAKAYMDLCQPYGLASNGGTPNHNSIILRANDAITINITQNDQLISGTYAIMGMQYA